MSEIYDVICAVNRLKDQISILVIKIEKLLKAPELLSFKKIVDEQTAASLLNISVRELQRIRYNGDILYTIHRRRINYPVAAINQYIKSHTVASKKPDDTTIHDNTRQ